MKPKSNLKILIIKRKDNKAHKQITWKISNQNPNLLKKTQKCSSKSKLYPKKLEFRSRNPQNGTPLLKSQQSGENSTDVTTK